MDITSGKGVSMVFDPLPDLCWENLPTLPLLVRPSSNTAHCRLLPTTFPLFPALGKGLTVRGYTLFEIVRNPERLARGKQFVYSGLESGALKPIIDRTFPLESIVDAHRYMESNQQKGKIVVTV